MTRAGKLILITGVTAAAAAAVAKRKYLAQTTVNVAATTRDVAVAAKTAVVHLVEAVGGSISAGTLRAALKYNIPRLVEQYRGALPFGVGVAIFEHETGGTFNPYIYNWCDSGSGCKRGSVHKDYATPGAPLVKKWMQPGDGGFAHDPHAVGVGQILDIIRLKQGGYGGVSLPYLNDLLDPEKNIHASLAGANANVKQYVAKYVSWDSNPLAFATSAYATHAEGGYGASKILKWAAANGGVTLDVLKRYPGSVANRLSGLIAVGKRALLWEAAKPQLLGGTLAGMRTLAALGLVTADGGVPLRWAA